VLFSGDKGIGVWLDAIIITMTRMMIRRRRRRWANSDGYLQVFKHFWTPGDFLHPNSGFQFKIPGCYLII